MPHTDMDAATMHAFKQSSLHCEVVTVSSVPAAAVPSATNASGMKERRWMLSQSKGESWVTAWGTRSGERGGVVGLVMVAKLCFLEVAALFLGEI